MEILELKNYNDKKITVGQKGERNSWSNKCAEGEGGRHRQKVGGSSGLDLTADISLNE